MTIVSRASGFGDVPVTPASFCAYSANAIATAAIAPVSIMNSSAQP
jgi:hypothetical protein